MERKHNILVQYTDGSLQWLREALESEVRAMPDVARIKAYCNSNFRVGGERWTTGRSDMEKIVISRPSPACGTERARK
jgi:hypothetical protein